MQWSIKTRELAVLYKQMHNFNDSTQLSNSYLNGGWFDEADALNIFHYLWIMLIGLQKSSTWVRNGTLLAFLKVVNKDIVVLLPGIRNKMLGMLWFVVCFND